MRNIWKFGIFFVALGLFSTLFFIPSVTEKPDTTTIKVVTTIFPAYDFARTISAETETDLKLLIKPGVDLHSFEPTPQDIINIKESDIFIYNGGESEAWVDKILSEIDTNNTTVIRMMDSVELLDEINSDIIEAETESDTTEYDEHIWTAPLNVVAISQKIAQAFINYLPNDSAIIQRNLDAFSAELEQLDQDFSTLAETKTGTLIVADRFPFRYFINAYRFDYVAAFPGCSEQTEASAKTITQLIEATNKNSQKVIFHLELSNTKIAQTVAESTHAKLLEWHSIHNVTQTDFDSGKTYLDFMRQNLTNLSEALSDAPQSN